MSLALLDSLATLLVVFAWQAIRMRPRPRLAPVPVRSRRERR